MCGITGFFSYKNKCEAEKYHDAHEKIAHRGPDDEGFLFKNENNELEPLIGHDTIKEFRNRPLLLSKKYPSHLILGHRRLSIIDLTSQGHQPFNFEHLYLIYNGEIFNYIELRDELIEAGYFFETDTDTEVFLKAYHCWGVESFNRFNGMWAAAIYDKKQDNILLTRDRFGIKPLYYSLVNDNLIFGSEIKFINSFFDVSEVNEQMVYEYLMLNHINHTDETVFKDISQLEPSHYLIYSKTGVSILKYWDLKIDNDSVKVEDIEKKLNHSINIRMRSDVEVGSLLSGGIDSSLILAIIDQSKCVNYFQTFSAVFNEEKYSEKKYIDDFTVDNINLKKHFIYPDPDKLIESI
jgi:asparagine synthase (glutamine-hydrolysing)